MVHVALYGMRGNQTSLQTRPVDAQRQAPAVLPGVDAVSKLHSILNLRTTREPCVVYEYCERCGAIRKWGTVTMVKGIPQYDYQQGIWHRGDVNAPYCLAEQQEARR
jgi:hypothetical protein